MADADEDRIPSLDSERRSQENSLVDDGSDADSDSDAAPDYRFLQATTASRKHALPARGTKEFEPNPTARQASNLDASRQAMIDALSVVRVHGRKGENIGVYFNDPAEWDAQKFDQAAIERVEDEEKKQRLKEVIAAKPLDGRCVAVQKFTTTYMKSMGQGDRRNWTWLLPEEALFLLERGTLDIRYALHFGESSEQAVDSSQDQTSEHEVKENSQELNVGKVPMSLQGAYAAFISKSGLTLERYIVYANLRRAGYIVQRAPTWHGSADSPRSTTPAQRSEIPSTAPSPTQSTSLIWRLMSWLFKSEAKPLCMPCYNSAAGPLLAPGLFQTYGDMFRQLYLISQHDAILDSTQVRSDVSQPDLEIQSQPSGEEPPLLPTFYVHKPSALAGYRKSAPLPPNYIVVVLDARKTTIPTSAQIGDLLASMPDEDVDAMSKKRLETRIKNGSKAVLLAIVDSGLVSYLRLSSGGFGPGNWLWEDNERKGKLTRGAKGGGGRGRGRGGGRGGRGRGR